MLTQQPTSHHAGLVPLTLAPPITSLPEYTAYHRTNAPRPHICHPFPITHQKRIALGHPSPAMPSIPTSDFTILQSYSAPSYPTHHENIEGEGYYAESAETDGA